MLVFAFCLLGLFIAFIKLGFDDVVDKSNDRKFKKAYKERDDFLTSITASKKEIEDANSDKDYTDVLDDIMYITNKECSNDLLRYYCYRIEKINNFGLNYKMAVEFIRLAKIGKVSEDFKVISGTSVVLNTEYYDEINRFYRLLAKCYSEAGIPTSVVIKNRMGDSPFVTMNLSIFEPKLQWLVWHSSKYK